MSHNRPHDPAGLSRRAFLSTTAAAVALGAGAVSLGAVVIGADRAGAAATEPRVFGTTAWRARPPSSPVRLAGRDPDKIIVHHTAFANTPDAGRSGSFAIARRIQTLHMTGNHWIDTGQHFTVSRSGIVMEGRHRSLERLLAGSDLVVGAHTVGQNSASIGIESNGTYTSAVPPAALYASLVGLCAYICHRYRIPAARIYGHRDYNRTECPGDRLYAMLPRLRGDVAARR